MDVLLHREHQLVLLAVPCDLSQLACMDTTQQTSIDVSCWTHFDELGALLWTRFEGAARPRNASQAQRLKPQELSAPGRFE